MSGLEIAGIVLAALPLVIEALDSYKAGKGRLAVFKRYGSSLQTLITDLRSQNVIFSNSIANVCRYAGVRLSDSTGFAQSAIGFAYDNDAEESVRRCLGEAYHPIVDLIREYRIDVEKLAIKLREPVAGFDPSGMGFDEILDAERRPDEKYSFRSRLKFTMSKKEIDAMVQTLGRRSKLLERLCNSFKLSEAMEYSKPLSRGRKITSSLMNVKGHAQRLFSVMSDKWSNCHPFHEVNIKLDSRLDDGRRLISKKRETDVTFSVGMGAPESSSAEGLPWFEIRVIPMKEDLRTERACKVTFQVQHAEDADDWPGKNTVAERVDDICDVVTKAHQSSQDTRFFVSANNELRSLSKGLKPAPVLCTKELKAVSLATILDTRSNSKEGPKLDRATRLRIATILASTVFQFSGTAWMIPGAIKAHILFPLVSKAAKTEISPRVDVLHPFISADPNSTHNSDIPLKTSLLELGIVLLELWHNVSFENFCDERGEAPGNDFYQRLPLAHRWFDETEGDMLVRHSKAVSSCIRCLSKNANFDDSSFLSEMFEGILRPLEDNVKDTT